MTAHTARPGGRLVATARLLVASLVGLGWAVGFLLLAGVSFGAVLIAAICGSLIGLTVDTVLA